MKVVVFERLGKVEFVVIAKDLAEAREMVKDKTGMTKKDFTVVVEASVEKEHIMCF